MIIFITAQANRAPVMLCKMTALHLAVLFGFPGFFGESMNCYIMSYWPQDCSAGIPTVWCVGPAGKGLPVRCWTLPALFCLCFQLSLNCYVLLMRGRKCWILAWVKWDTSLLGLKIEVLCMQSVPGMSGYLSGSLKDKDLLDFCIVLFL